jgi:hypothetical protein
MGVADWACAEAAARIVPAIKHIEVFFISISSFKSAQRQSDEKVAARRQAGRETSFCRGLQRKKRVRGLSLVH